LFYGVPRPVSMETGPIFANSPYLENYLW